jgi:hypothetical protein
MKDVADLDAAADAIAVSVSLRFRRRSSEVTSPSPGQLPASDRQARTICSPIRDAASAERPRIGLEPCARVPRRARAVGVQHRQDRRARAGQLSWRDLVPAIWLPDPAIRRERLFYASSDPGQEPRHVGTLEPLWNLFDLTPEGRPGDWAEQFSYD